VCDLALLLDTRMERVVRLQLSVALDPTAPAHAPLLSHSRAISELQLQTAFPADLAHVILPVLLMDKMDKGGIECPKPHTLHVETPGLAAAD
jgi:hypothetical protein